MMNATKNMQPISQVLPCAGFIVRGYEWDIMSMEGSIN